MNKKAQTGIALASGIGGIILIIGLIVVGSSEIFHKNEYVGDFDTKLVYDISRCKVAGEIENPVFFDNLEEAYSLGYKDAPKCV